LGVRSAAFINGLQSTLALWKLDSDSELVFVGDAGTTEVNRPSHRYGVEMTHYYRPMDWLVVDADMALSRAKFSDTAPEGQYISGAIDKTASFGLAISHWHNWSAGLRLRYLGSRPLIEDNSIRSASSALTKAKISYQLTPTWQTSIEVLNVFDKAVNDIEYFYSSCTAADSIDSRCDPNSATRDGIEDKHIHPSEPRTLRLTLRGTW
jgi:outer membrane receptor protein involved in Fe transport